VIPGWGVVFGPVLALALVAVLFTTVVEVLFFTLLLDRPQLPTRRRAAVAGVVMALFLAAAALLAPYEGEDRHRCGSAFMRYHFATDALAGGSTSDACAAPGQLLVVFGWTTPVLIALVVGIWRWSGDS
jgi:hypothetical protein